MAKPKTITLAEQIFKVDEELRQLEEAIKPLKEKRDELRSDMLLELRAKRMESFRSDLGLTFSRSIKFSFEITDPVKAKDWALKHDCIKVDTAAAMRKFRQPDWVEVPEGMEVRETEFISVRSNLSDNDESV